MQREASGLTPEPQIVRLAGELGQSGADLEALGDLDEILHADRRSAESPGARKPPRSDGLATGIGHVEAQRGRPLRCHGPVDARKFGRQRGELVADRLTGIRN